MPAVSYAGAAGGRFAILATGMPSQTLPPVRTRDICIACATNAVSLSDGLSCRRLDKVAVDDGGAGAALVLPVVRAPGCRSNSGRQAGAWLMQHS